jgi:hypothetical protein
MLKTEDQCVNIVERGEDLITFRTGEMYLTLPHTRFVRDSVQVVLGSHSSEFINLAVP